MHAESLVLHGRTATNKQLPSKLNPKAMLLPAGGKFLAVICCYLTDGVDDNHVASLRAAPADLGLKISDFWSGCLLQNFC